jgi:RNA polymerase sigma-70 factor (ECF subfamily)
MSREEKQIIAKESETSSIDDICTSTYEALYRFVYFKVQNRQEAEDITQETYVKALSHIRKSGIQIEKHISFLKTVSLNVLRDRWRSKKHRGAYVGLEAINPEETAVDDPTDESLQREEIQEALSRLSEELRNVVVLRIIKGYSVAESAEILHKKEGNIRVMQYRALKNLAEILKSNGKYKKGGIVSEDNRKAII